MPRIPGARSLGAHALQQTGVLARWSLGDTAELVVASNLGRQAIRTEPVDGPLLFESHAGDARKLAQGTLAPRSTVALLLEAAS